MRGTIMADTLIITGHRIFRRDDVSVMILLV